jgi:predicted  nucleic acid-binding Zn-ribbon protein
MREIHRLRRYAHNLKEQIDRFPQQLKVQQMKTARQEENHKESQDGLKKLKVANNDKEVSLKATHGKIKKYEESLNTAADKKEYDALKHQIATCREQAQQLEDEIFAGMAEVEECTAKLPEQAKGVEKAKQDLVQWEKEARERHAHQTEELKETQEKIKEAETAVPSNQRLQYNRMIQAMGADALSSVQGRNCVACMTEITAQMYNDLLQQQFVFCKACGRILYLPEMAAVE